MLTSSVSVVVPVFNRECFLRETLQSICAQSLAPYEIIVLDDGSTDNSRAVVREFGPSVSYFYQENQGIGAARNAGVAQASGEFLAFLDSDDLWSVDALESRARVLESDKKLDMVFGHAQNFLSPEVKESDLAKLNIFEPLPGFSCGGMLIRRKSLNVVGPFRTDLKTGEFIEWMARADELGLRRKLITNTVLQRRIHTSNHTLSHQNGYLRILKETLDRRRMASV